MADSVTTEQPKRRGRPRKDVAREASNFARTLQIPFDGMALRRTPSGFSTIPLQPGQKQLLNRFALEAFVPMVNNGFSLAECLTAVYITGMRLAVDIISEKPEVLKTDTGRSVDRIDVGSR